MPQETLVVKQLTKEEESALNTAAAMIAAFDHAYLSYFSSKIEALCHALFAYPGSFDTVVGVAGTSDLVKVSWDGVVKNLMVSEGDKSSWTPIENADPKVQIVVAQNVEKIAVAFTIYLDKLMKIGQHCV